MKKWGMVIALIGLLAGPAVAQHQLTQYTTLFSGTGTGDGSTRLDVQSFSSVLLKVRIASTGTVNFKGSADGSDETNLATCALVSDTAGAQVASTTASGDYFCSTANLKEVFINVSANGSGVTVQAIGSTASAKRGGSGGSGSVTSVDASGGVETASGSAITGTGTIRGNTSVNAQTGTTYTILSVDRGKLITFTNASPVAVTLPEAGTAGFDDGFYFQAVNLGAGTVTITPTTSTIQGGPDIDLETGKGTTIASDGTNYVHNPGLGLTVETQTLESVSVMGRRNGTAVSEATAEEVGSTAANAFWTRYYDSTDGLISTCKIDNILHNCNRPVRLYNDKEFFITDRNGNKLWRVVENTTGFYQEVKERSSDPGAATSGYWRSYFKSGGLYTQDAAGTVVGPLVAASQINAPVIVRKTANETVNNSATAQNDDHLSFAVAANSYYTFNMFIVYSAATAADLRHDFTVPAGTTGFFRTVAPTAGSTSCTNSPGTDAGLIETVNVSMGGGGVGSQCIAVLTGYVATAGTAGTVQFQWAQATANASDAVVYADSHLVYQKQ